MFSGITSHLGTIEDVDEMRLTISAPHDFVKKLKIGTSVAVQGACLTIINIRKNTLTVDVMPETRARTCLRYLSRGSLVNLELPVTPNTFLSGHLVQGHVDGTARLKHVAQKKEGRVLEFSISPSLAAYIVEKGSIAVNGVALTVIQAEKTHFTVGVIPHTWRETAIHTMKTGDTANIEVDVIAKYVEKQVKKRI